MKRAVFALAFIFAGLSFAQQPNPSGPVVFPPAQVEGGPLTQQIPAPSEALTTPEVERLIQDKLSSEQTFASEKVNVMTNDSSVVLAGNVANEAQHDFVVQTARSYAGKRQIVDNIKVRPSA